MTLRAGKFMLNSKVSGSSGIKLESLANLAGQRGFQHCSTSTELSTKNLGTMQSGGQFLKSTRAANELGQRANSTRNYTTLEADRLTSVTCNTASAIIHDVLRLGREPHTNLFNASNNHRVASLSDPAISITLRTGLGNSSNVSTMRPVQNWCSTAGYLHSPKITQFGEIGTRRTFSTTATLEASGKKDGKECKKKGGGLPCLKPVGLGADEKSKKASNSKDCEKFCMPCCAPARDPPTCVVAQKKRECKKFRPPRPAYSECKKDPMKPIKPCECLIQRLPPCGRDSQSQSFKNC